MSTVTMTNTIEPPETTESREYSPERSISATQPFSDGCGLRKSWLTGSDDNPVTTVEIISANTDHCTYETQETYETEEIDEVEEAEESQEAEDSEEREELATLTPEFSMAIDEAISECRPFDNG